MAYQADSRGDRTPRLVVGAALHDEAGRLLAAQRRSPSRYAGCWEFPGGKVEDGEDPVAALVRECREELGVDVTVDRIVGEVDIPIGRLRVYTGRIAKGELRATEHSALRWLTPDEYDDVDWIDADRPLVELLRQSWPGSPGYFT